MAVDPMGSAWAKYHWASKHMKAVEGALMRSLDPDGHSVTLNIKVEERLASADAVVRIETMPTLRTEIGLSLGDVFQNFRAALDHLAWALVKLGSDPRPEHPEWIYFPMARNAGSLRANLHRWLPGVQKEYRAIIRRYQPYRRGEGPKAMRWLRNFSDTDKHRVLVPAAINQAEINLRFAANWPLTSMEKLVRGRRALNVGTPILKASFIRPGSTNCQVQVEGEIALYPSLGYGVPLGDALGLVRMTVFEILSTFDDLL
jgi:hypothetical protein